MFEFSLSVRVSFWLEGVGRMPRRGAATQGSSGTAPETSRNAFGTNQGTNEDDSQSDPHPEAGIFHNQTTQISSPEDGHDTRRVCLGYPYPSLWMKTKIFPLVKQSSHLIMMLRIDIHARAKAALPRLFWSTNKTG